MYSRRKAICIHSITLSKSELSERTNKTKRQSHKEGNCTALFFLYYVWFWNFKIAIALVQITKASMMWYRRKRYCTWQYVYAISNILYWGGGEPFGWWAERWDDDDDTETTIHMNYGFYIERLRHIWKVYLVRVGAAMLSGYPCTAR